MNIKELVEIIASKHNLELSQTDTALLVDSIDSNHGQLFLVPNYDENNHCIKCAIKIDERNKIMRLTMYFDTQWQIRKVIDHDTDLEIDDLILIENQVNESITNYFLESRRVLHFDMEKLS